MTSLPTLTAARVLRGSALVLSLLAPAVFAKTLPQPRNLPQGVRVERDISYIDGGDEAQRLDLYLPEAVPEKPLPLLVYIHGGGWRAGSKVGCPVASYAARGYIVASVEYRFSQKAIFPAQIQDCQAAIRWLRAHAEEYGLDAKAFGVGGSSAGGHLVALVGTSGGVREFDVGQHLDMSSAVQAVYDLYGPTDLIRFGQTPGYESHATAESPEGKLLGGAPAQMKEAAAKANPITHIDANDPPFLIVHGDADPTVPINQSESLYAALVEAGIPTRFITIQGGGHGRGFPSEPLVEIANVFFDKNLRGNAEAADWPKAMTSELKAAAANLQRPDNARPRIPFAILQRREDTNGDGQITRDEFKGPPAIFDHLDKNGDQVLTKSDWE